MPDNPNDDFLNDIAQVSAPQSSPAPAAPVIPAHAQSLQGGTAAQAGEPTEPTQQQAAAAPPVAKADFQQPQLLANNLQQERQNFQQQLRDMKQPLDLSPHMPQVPIETTKKETLLDKLIRPVGSFGAGIV